METGTAYPTADRTMVNHSPTDTMPAAPFPASAGHLHARLVNAREGWRPAVAEPEPRKLAAGSVRWLGELPARMHRVERETRAYRRYLERTWAMANIAAIVS